MLKGKWFKRLRRWLIILILLSGGVFLLWPKPKVTTYTTEQPRLDRVEQIVSVTGTVEAKPQINLQFKTGGKLDQVFVKVGEFVSSGAVLAKLDTANLELAVEQAKIGVSIAEANLHLREAGPSTEDKVLSQTAITNATTALAASQLMLTNTEKTTAENLERAELTRQTALVNLENARIQYEKTLAQEGTADSTSQERLTNALANATSQINAALFDATTALHAADRLLGVDQIRQNDDIENYLAVLDQSSKQTADTLYRQASWSLSQLQSPPPTDPKLYLSQTKQVLEEIRQAIHATYTVLTNTITGPNLTDTTLAGYKTSTQNTEATLQKDILTLQSNLDQITSAELGQDSSSTTNSAAVAAAKATLDNATIALHNATTGLTQTKTENKKALDAARAEVDLKTVALENARAAYRLKIATPRAVDLGALQASVAQAQTNLRLAEQNLADATLTAPVSGQITALNFELGEMVTGTMVEMITAELLVKANIAETDIAKIAVGDSVSMTLDAFSLDRIFTGQIIEIDPAETVVQGVIYYQTKIAFTQTYPEIKSGMTANADILAATRENVLTVSPQAVLYKDNKPYVRVLQADNTPREQSVTVGLEGNKLIEILSGLTSSDKLILYENK